MTEEIQLPEHIVSLQDASVDDCARLYMSVFNAEPYLDSWTEQTARRRILELVGTPGFVGYAHVEDGKPVGLIMGYTRQWYNGLSFDLQDVCVDLDYQGRGIGTGLCDYLEQVLIAKGVHRLFLLTLRGGPGDIFYTKRGYQYASRTMVMVKQLKPNK